MAVGRTGSFATVQPDTGVIDIAGMVEDQFDDVKKLQDKQAGLQKKVEEEKDVLTNTLKTPERKVTQDMNFDELTYKYVGGLQDEYYNIQQEIQSGNISLAEGRAKLATYNRKIDDWKQFQATYTPAVENFVKLRSEGKLSSAYPENAFEEGGIFSVGIDGSIEEIKTDENGDLVVKPYGDKNRYNMKRLAYEYQNPHLAINADSVAKDLGKEFVAQIRDLARQNKKGVYDYFTDTLTEGISQNQIGLIKRKAAELVSDPKLQSDLWFKATGRRNFDGLNEQQVSELAEYYGNQMVNTAKAYMTDKIQTEYARGEARQLREAQEKEQPSYMPTGKPDYEREYRDVNGLYVVEDPDSVVEKFPLKDDVEVVPNVTGIRISNQETGEQETEVIKNFRLEKYFIDDKGNFVARGNKVTTLGESGSKEIIGSGMDSINIEDLREKRPAQTERISVIIPLTDAGRVLAAAGYNAEEIKSELDLMRSLQGTKSSVDETSKFNIEGEKKESSGFNLDEYLKEKGLK